jgi:uncharacterized protein YjbJ (UPF0337 family)
MDKDRIKGKADDIAGRVKRQVGEWTGDEKAQTERAAQQVKGKVQNAWGKTKDAVRDTAEDAGRHDRDDDAARKDRNVA